MVESTQALQSNVPYAPDHHFPLENIPFGVFQNPSDNKPLHCCTRIGDLVIDLAVLFAHGVFNGPHFSQLKSNPFNHSSLNEFIALGKEIWHEARTTIQALFTKGNGTLQDYAFKDHYSFDVKDAKMQMPIAVGDYTDFYSSKNHAYNVGVMFRGHDNAL
jgi:fumarylacetoacetase